MAVRTTFAYTGVSMSQLQQVMLTQQQMNQMHQALQNQSIPGITTSYALGNGTAENITGEQIMTEDEGLALEEEVLNLHDDEILYLENKHAIPTERYWRDQSEIYAFLQMYPKVTATNKPSNPNVSKMTFPVAWKILGYDSGGKYWQDNYSGNQYTNWEKLKVARKNKTDKRREEIKKISRLKSYQPGQPIDEYIDHLIEVLVKRTGEESRARLKWLKTFRNCVLPDNVKSMIEEALTVILCKQKFDDWGINEHFEKGLTNSIMLYGPPGTGKTMIAESFAAVLGKNLMKLTNAELQSQIPGQVERNITDSFNKAKEHNCVLMLDECDSLLYNRDAVGMIIAAEINHLLTNIENFDGVVILTTNRLGRLDPALQRRIIAKVKLPLPTKEARTQIWKNLMPPKMPLEDNINFEELAATEISGGDIKNAILLAARKAIAKNAAKVGQEHFKNSLSSVETSKKEFEKSKPKKMSSNEVIGKSMSYDKMMGLNTDKRKEDTNERV